MRACTRRSHVRSLSWHNMENTANREPEPQSTSGFVRHLMWCTRIHYTICICIQTICVTNRVDSDADGIRIYKHTKCVRSAQTLFKIYICGIYGVCGVGGLCLCLKRVRTVRFLGQSASHAHAARRLKCIRVRVLFELKFKSRDKLKSFLGSYITS